MHPSCFQFGRSSLSFDRLSASGPCLPGRNKKRAKLCIVARSEAKLTQAHAKLDIIIRVYLLYIYIYYIVYIYIDIVYIISADPCLALA